MNSSLLGKDAYVWYKSKGGKNNAALSATISMKHTTGERPYGITPNIKVELMYSDGVTAAPVYKLKQTSRSQHLLHILQGPIAGEKLSNGGPPRRYGTRSFGKDTFPTVTAEGHQTSFPMKPIAHFFYFRSESNADTVVKARGNFVSPTSVLCIHSRVIFRGYLSEDLVSEDGKRRQLRGCVECTHLKLRTRYIFY